jgi:hypothetical protein
MAGRNKAQVAATEATQAKVGEQVATEATQAKVGEQVATEATQAQASDRGRLRSQLESVRSRKFTPVEGDACDAFLLIDGPTVKSGDSEIPSFFVVHASGTIGANGDRPIYWAKGNALSGFDFLTMGNFSEYATITGIPVVGFYYWSLDSDKIEIHPSPQGLLLPISLASLLDKFRKKFVKVDPRWLKLRGLI